MRNMDFDQIEATGLDKKALAHAARASSLHAAARENLENAVRELTQSAQPYTPAELGRFFQVVGLYQKVLKRDYMRKDSLRAVHEVVRQLLTGEANEQRWKRQSFGMMEICTPDEDGEESDLKFTDAIRFLKTLQEFKSMAYKALFNVVGGKGDDGYGDFIDSLILAGPDIYAKVLSGAYREGEWKRLQADIREATPELGDFIIEGENYIAMFTEDKITEFMQSWVRRQVERDRNW